MREWEYKTLRYLRPDHWEEDFTAAAGSGGDYRAFFNRVQSLGRQGWELVTIDPSTGVWVFKREVADRSTSDRPSSAEGRFPRWPEPGLLRPRE